MTAIREAELKECLSFADDLRAAQHDDLSGAADRIADLVAEVRRLRAVIGRGLKTSSVNYREWVNEARAALAEPEGGKG